jgi:hypothetical protein
VGGEAYGAGDGGEVIGVFTVHGSRLKGKLDHEWDEWARMRGDWTAHGDEGEGKRWGEFWGESLKGCAWDDLGWREVGAWADQSGGLRVPRWVRGHTKMGVRAYQDGCVGTPRWV